MSVPRHHIASGRSNLETSQLGEDILNIINDIIDGKLLGSIVEGRVQATAISGNVGPSQGGTGNAIGQTVPLDGSVTDVKVATGADIDPAKLNQVLLKDKVYALVKAIALAGSGVTRTVDDGLETLTFSVGSVADSIIPAGPCHIEDTLGNLLNDLFCRLRDLETVIGGYGLGPYGEAPYGM
jgi:hypothetical protein